MATTQPTAAPPAKPRAAGLAPVAGVAPAAGLSENEQLARINADYDERYGFHDAENYL